MITVDMLSQEEINSQQQLLTTYRRTLAHLIRQAAQYGGEVYVPPHVANGIYEARDAIRQIKATLRQHGVSVADLPDDHPRMPGVLASRLSSSEQRNRSRMLEKVRAFWIKGVLENSLHGAALIELGLEEHPDAVAHPWDMLVQQPNRPASPLPPGTTITEVFDQFCGDLLILGVRRFSVLGSIFTLAE